MISISLPHGYPDQNPQASVQCASLSRNNHESLNSELKHYLSLSENGALCVGTLIEWVKENFENFLSASTQSEQVHCTSTNSSETKSLRLWIQSHHIYSKTKMDNIQDWAKQLCLRGFILPGKPGFLCVEGGEKNCQQWWQQVHRSFICSNYYSHSLFPQVRGMNWQKITCRLEERDSEKKFLIFENIAAIRNSEQSGMKAFLKYLEEHASSHVFKEFFGFDGK